MTRCLQNRYGEVSKHLQSKRNDWGPCEVFTGLHGEFGMRPWGRCGTRAFGEDIWINVKGRARARFAGGAVFKVVQVLTESEFKPEVFEFGYLMFQGRLEQP